MVLLAIAGILLLGGGIIVLVSNLRKPAGGAGMLDQIGTYGYVAEAARGAGETAGRRPLDSLAGRLGDTAARRLSRYSEDKVRQKLIAAGMYGTSRSEEHTSELQSRVDLVCRLLLKEKTP